MSHDPNQDPWVSIRTRSGLAADEVISALQKEIRRNNVENAALLANEMLTSSPELEAKLWQRLMVVSVEDIGWGDVQAPLLIHALHRMRQEFVPGSSERRLFALHAVRFLCRCAKDRSSDEMSSWIRRQVESGRLAPAIPDYALDMHTERGRRMGRDARHFYEEAARVSPELPGRDASYRQKLMELLADS